MKALRTLTILFALALMCLPAPSAAAEKPFKLDICAMPEHESFIFWYAKEQGWDKDEGLDFQIHFFQTGMDQLEALPAKQWVVGGTGTVPILVGALRYNTYLNGIAHDDGAARQSRPQGEGLEPRVSEPPRLSRNREGQDLPLYPVLLAALRHVRIPEGPRPHGKGRGHAEHGPGAGAGCL